LLASNHNPKMASDYRNLVAVSFESIEVSRSSADNLEYEITVKGGHVPLSDFQPRETNRGISARPWGKRRIFGGTFFGPGDRVFARESRERLPIRQLWGPSLATKFERGQSYKLALEIAQETFSRRLAREIGRIMPGGSKGSSGD
jgi:hypothetical protein